MITKKQLLDIWIKYDDKSAPKKYKDLFSENGFMRLIQGTFMSKEDMDEYFHRHIGGSWYCSPLLEGDYRTREWTELMWYDLLNSFIKFRLTHNNNYYYDAVIKGILVILEIYNIHHLTEDEVIPEYRRFYNATKYGYFNMPFIIDVANHFEFDISEYLKTYKGFVEENTIPKFDMNTWQDIFKKSKQITTLKNSVTDGRMLNKDEMPKYNWGEFDHFKISNQFYPYAEYMYKIHTVVGHYIPLRKVDTGSTYVEELIKDYGWLVGFYDTTPIYKINTVQGFAFYICGSYCGGGVYIDNILIKKIKFVNPKPENTDIDSQKRIFIIYNEKTGYWQLPELYYPVKYKNFIQDVLKKQKKIIGKWNETVVYANSRTLCGDTYHFNLDNYPDIRTKNEFIQNIANNAIEKAINSLHLKHTYSSLGLKVKIEYDNNAFNFNETIKELNCITQEDINKYLNPYGVIDMYGKDIFETEFYTI